MAGVAAETISDLDFCRLMLDLRDAATRLIDKRIHELFRWDTPERHRIERWFGIANDDVRHYVSSGLVKCKFLLQNFTCQNFVRYIPDWSKPLGCVSPEGTPAAQVCPSDTQAHTIAIDRSFFNLLQISPSKDSQLSTLIHEVTHFHDTFSSKDLRYGLNAALRYTSVPALARINADNIAGYIVEGVIYGD